MLTDRQDKTITILKDALCKAPVLAYPDPDVQYIMDMDNINLAIDAVHRTVRRR